MKKKILNGLVNMAENSPMKSYLGLSSVLGVQYGVVEGSSWVLKYRVKTCSFKLRAKSVSVVQHLSPGYFIRSNPKR